VQGTQGNYDKSLELTDAILNVMEYVEFEEDHPLFERQGELMENTANDEDSYEEFEWMDTISSKELNSDTYFCYINESRETMKAGQQAFFKYGDHSNKTLLVQYGFCIENNLYESYKFDVRLDLNFSKDKPIQTDDMIRKTNVK